MKFLISTSFPSFRAMTNLSTCVHFCDPSSDLSAPLTSRETVDVWICNGEEVTNELMDRWLDQACHIPKSMLVGDTAIIPRLQEYANGRAVEIAGFPDQKYTTIQWEESILRDAEMLYARGRAHAGIQQLSVMKEHDRKTTVLLVGAGIVNLMTAELLAARGYQVRVVDAGPDPQCCKDWTCLGITNGGGNARMFTHTEADNYNEKGSEIYQNMQSIFRQTVRNGGWSVKSPKDFTAAELAWVNAFERLPAWLAQIFRENIYEVNMEAGKLWKEYIETSPQLFEDVEFCKNILRMYVEPVAMDAAIKLNRQLGAIIQATSLEEFLTGNPGFHPAAELNHLSGGITVEGFTVNIHPFVAKLIDRITGFGGEFLWNCEVQGIQRNSLGEVTTLESKSGHLEADHFVVSPGVTGDVLLRGTACENLVQGVLGVWLQIPNLHPQMQHSIKIHRRAHLVEDINVTVAKDAETGEDILVFGGGYGYVGLDRPRQDCPELIALFNELEEVARIYFPRGYAVAQERGIMYPGGNRKFCVRPFTPTGLGLFEMIPTASGGHLIITGGNNTGGFAQSPAIARAVWRAVVGEQDPIHVLFHPDRGRLSTSVTYKSRFHEPLSLRSIEAQQPLRLLLLCSDDPQHSYLRYRLDQTFPGYRCIVETHDGQVRHLRKKGRTADVCYMKYHSLRRYYSGNDHQRKAYFNQLVPQDHASPTPDLTVDSLNCREVWEAVEQWKPELTIISGTKYIGRKLTERAGLMINLHTGHLPEYKGNHCIFFALYDGAVDKVSATLHQLTSDLDGGNILDRVFPPILPDDNEEMLYARCVHLAIDRCVKHAEQFSRGERLEFVPQEAIGRTFRNQDRTPGKELQLWWKLRVGGLLRNYQGTAGKPLGDTKWEAQCEESGSSQEQASLGKL
jgi:glycine/D-amino acid oxidase-like deaminating enzyme/folate-dependent phosphoribosylglycinamide formyltransferase PurN